MSLYLLILTPLAAGLTSALFARDDASRARFIAATGLVLDLLLLLPLALQTPHDGTPWTFEARLPWIPHLGASLYVALDGLSLLMLFLTVGLGLVAVWVRPNVARPGAYYLCILATLSGLVGVFLAADLLLFFVFYEIMLVPMYLLVALWGDERLPRSAVATRFFLYTQAGGLLMLVGILGVYFYRNLGGATPSFAYTDLLNTAVPPHVGVFLLLGFVAAFAVKLPAVPFHGWQADTYACLPTGAGIVLSGIMAKAGAYGLLRFAVPLFPDAARLVAPWVMALAAVSILYGAWVAFAQTDLRRFIAYSGISHLGFVLLGAFVANDLAYRGAVVQMLCHGISATGLFLLADLLEERTGTRDLKGLGGLWTAAPRLGAFGLLLVMATLGLPGLGNFVGEFLVLIGSFRQSPVLTSAAALGAVFATAYALRLMQRVFYGPRVGTGPVRDLTGAPAVVALAIAGMLLVLGLYPQPVLRLVDPTRSLAAHASADHPRAASAAHEGDTP